MTLFLRLNDEHKKEEFLSKSIADIRSGNHVGFEVEPNSFNKIPKSPFAYWAVNIAARVFDQMQPLSRSGFDIERGGSTMDDFRYVRTWWEVKNDDIAQNRSETLRNKRWVVFSKGGSFSTFYRDWELVLDWFRDGEILKREISNYRSAHGWGDQWTAALNGHEFYFLPGISWARRTQSGLNLRILPRGCIFSDKSPTIISKNSDSLDLLPILAIMNSIVFESFVGLQMSFGSYEVGVINRTPIPSLDGNEGNILAELAVECFNIKRVLDRVNEVSHVFIRPVLFDAQISSFFDFLRQRSMYLDDASLKLSICQDAIDEIALRLYGISNQEFETLKMSQGLTSANEESDEETDEDLKSGSQLETDTHTLAADLVSYCVGAEFGRWDLRYALGERPEPALPDPFDPLPAYSPGMLRPEEEPGYPISFNKDGILPDDEDSPSDLISSLRDTLELVFEVRAREFEEEICQALGVKTLRDYFRKTGKGGFWQDHLQKYSKSRRKAPIYWLLQSPKGRYGLWLYYPRLTGDTLAHALQEYVEPKLRREQERLVVLRADVQGLEGRARREVERQMERQEELLNDIQDFRERLERVVRRGLKPDHNDGVLLTIAPLWELVPWAEAKRAWDELQAGKYEWSSISRQLRGLPFEEPEAQPEPSEEPTPPDPREERSVLGRLRLRNLGPATELDLQLDPRINIMTGDNGLGKTFVLDAAWQALTGVAPPIALRPAPNNDVLLRPEITYELINPDTQLLRDTGTLFYDRKSEAWKLGGERAEFTEPDSNPSSEEDTSGLPEDDTSGLPEDDTSGLSEEDISEPPEEDTSKLVSTIQPRPGLVLYEQADGNIAVWDRIRCSALEEAGFSPAITFSQEQLWKGIQPLCRGLIADISDWYKAARNQALPGIQLSQEEQIAAALFRRLNQLLVRLSPDYRSGDDPESDTAGRELFTIAGVGRISIVDTTEYPLITMPYGLVPIIHASAGVKRILSIAYGLVWAYQEHQRAAQSTGQQPYQQMVLLLDEAELHLHPKWQRRIVPALFKALEEESILGETLHVQFLITTHAPLVLASLEPHFDEDQDQLFDFDLEGGKVRLTPRVWVKQGDVANWLTSEAFDLATAYSPEAEEAITAADALLNGEDMSQFPERLRTQQGIDKRLREVVPGHDLFWVRWMTEAYPSSFEDDPSETLDED